MSIRSGVVDLLLRALDPIERDVVEGDLNELRLHWARSIRELLGLLARRQVTAWLDWRPWAAVVLVALPLGMVLSLVSRYWANVTAIYAWLYIDNWTSAYLASPGSRSDLLHTTTLFSVECVALTLWAWTIGFAVASVSRRTAWVTYALFGLFLFAGTFGSTTTAVRNSANAAVFSLTLYRVGLPLVFRIVFILLPALHGMRKAVREPTITWGHSAALVGSVILVTGVVARGTRGAMMFGWWSVSGDGPTMTAFSNLRGSWTFWLLPFAMTLPATYVFSNASWQSWRRRTQSS
jgi:hypothetical protein